MLSRTFGHFGQKEGVDELEGEYSLRRSCKTIGLFLVDYAFTVFVLFIVFSLKLSVL